MVERSSSSSSSTNSSAHAGGGGAAAAALSPVSSSSSQSHSAALAAELKADASASSPAAAAAKGKRVFVFQKRWLHSLPIVEKTLADAPSAGAAAGKREEPATREVVACMLCDEPQQQQQQLQTSHGHQPQQHLVKMWSRTNCRRGRIENHLTSKHPEFMLLLKHKRDAEGELAVQLFLQDMRDGRCSLRSEINLGLYTHIRALNAAQASAEAAAGAVVANSSADSAAELKRGFANGNIYTLNRESFSGLRAALPLPLCPPITGAGGVLKASLELVEAENRRKRARLAEPSDDVLTNGASSAATDLASDGAAPRDWQQETLSAQSSPEMATFAQWQAVFFNRLVVLTGGDHEFVSGLATTFWLLGANVLLTFSSLPALKEFSASHAARYPEAEASSSTSESHRGVLLPLHCAFQTRKQIDEWSCAVADKFPRVDFLINFVDDDEDEGERRGSEAAEGANDADTYLVSSANRLLELCQSITALGFQPGGSGSIVNITTQSDGVRMNWAAVEAMTKALAAELQLLGVQVNCVLLHRIAAAGPDQAVVDRAQRLAAQEQQTAALSHAIMFLLSPASAAVSGSVLRLQHRTWTSASAAPEQGATASTAAAAAAKPVSVDQGDALESVNEVV